VRGANINLTRVSTLDRVVHDLRQRLLRGGTSDDRPLPTVRALARREGVSQATAQAAYQQLEAEGLVEAKPRIGRFAVHLSPRQRRRKALAVLHETLRAPVADALANGLSRTLIPHGVGAASQPASRLIPHALVEPRRIEPSLASPRRPASKTSMSSRICADEPIASPGPLFTNSTRSSRILVSWALGPRRAHRCALSSCYVNTSRITELSTLEIIP